MNWELAEALKAALDDGCSLAELETTLLADRDSDDHIAAAWLYAWAYDAIRPQHDNLAERITDRAAPAPTPKRREALDAAIEASVFAAHSPHARATGAPSALARTPRRTRVDARHGRRITPSTTVLRGTQPPNVSR